MNKAAGKASTITAIVAGLLVLVGCSSASTSTSTTTAPTTAASSTTIVEDASTTTSTIGSTTTTVEASTTTTTSVVVSTTTSSTTTTVPEADPAEVRIVKAQADGVVRNFLDRIRRYGVYGAIPLKDADPFRGAAREFLQMRESRVKSIEDSVETVDWGAYADNNPYLDGSMDKYFLPETYLRAGTKRIVPIGDGLYYVDGIYQSTYGIQTIVGGFHFTVENDQAMLTDMFVWTANGEGALAPTAQLTRGWLLSTRLVDSSQVSLTNTEGAMIQHTIEQAYVDLIEGSSGFVDIVTTAKNLSDVSYQTGVTTVGEIETRGTAVDDGDYARLFAEIREFNTEEETVFIMRGSFVVDVEPQGTRNLYMHQLIPNSTTWGYTNVIFDVKEKNSQTGADSIVTATVTIDLDVPVRCTQVDADETVFDRNTCSTPKVTYNG